MVYDAECTKYFVRTDTQKNIIKIGFAPRLYRDQRPACRQIDARMFIAVAVCRNQRTACIAFMYHCVHGFHDTHWYERTGRLKRLPTENGSASSSMNYFQYQRIKY